MYLAIPRNNRIENKKVEQSRKYKIRELMNCDSEVKATSNTRSANY